MYLKAPSLDNKLDEFKVIIEHKSKTNGITETWFEEISITNLDGYCLYSKDRSDERRGGGVCLYIDNEIYSVDFNYQRLSLSKLEKIWIVLYF